MQAFDTAPLDPGWGHAVKVGLGAGDAGGAVTDPVRCQIFTDQNISVKQPCPTTVLRAGREARGCIIVYRFRRLNRYLRLADITVVSQPRATGGRIPEGANEEKGDGQPWDEVLVPEKKEWI